MRVLWVATKLPEPAIDGGRLLMATTLDALRAAGVGGVLVAPSETASRRIVGGWEVVGVPSRTHWWRLLRRASAGSHAVARHVAPAVARAVARLVRAGRFDVVHAEQIYALPQCAAAIARGLPLVLRAQNVEQDVLAARPVPPPFGALARGEARRLAAFEAAAVRRATAAIALTPHDARRLEALGASDVRVIAPPFPPAMPAGPSLPGAPAVVLFGSAGWFPNRQGAAWFVSEVWPVVRARLPAAMLHVVGVECRRDDALGIVPHAPPRSSRDAFARDAILVVPSRIASGIRMKILEAWARDVAVVATPAAATGLDLAGDPVALADEPQAFADAIARLHDEPARAASQRRAGRAALERRHDPRTVAAALAALYDEVRAGRIVRGWRRDRPAGTAAARGGDPREVAAPGA